MTLQFGTGMRFRTTGVVFEPSTNIEFRVRITVSAGGRHMFDKRFDKSVRVIATVANYRPHQDAHKMGAQCVLAPF